MMRMTILAATMILLAAPAVAGEPATQGATAKSAAAAVKERKYCIQYVAPTGSRIVDRQCKTKAAWAREGVKLDEPARD